MLVPRRLRQYHATSVEALSRCLTGGFPPTLTSGPRISRCPLGACFEAVFISRSSTGVIGQARRAKSPPPRER